MRKKNNKFKLTLIIFFLTLTTILISLYNLVNSYNKNVGREKFIDFSISQEENFFQIEKYDILDDSSLNNKRLSELTKEDINISFDFVGIFPIIFSLNNTLSSILMISTLSDW